MLLNHKYLHYCYLLLCCTWLSNSPANALDNTFFKQHCYACHAGETTEGNLDLAKLPHEFEMQETFTRWVKIYDRIEAGEMPPKAQQQPSTPEKQTLLQELQRELLAAEDKLLPRQKGTQLRRLTRAEYENTVRDLFAMPGIALQSNLPNDGSAHGFDKNSDALDISHVNMAKYVEAADYILNLAIATRPTAPTIQKRRISLANRGGFVAHIIMNGDGVLLKNKKPDPDFPPAGEQNHLDQGAHERWGSFNNGATVGLFRHEDESVSPYFMEHVTIYPGLYRVRTSLWAFQWDKGEVLPARGTEAARLSVVQLTGDGRGGQHPSYVLGYFNAPSMNAQEHELTTWLNHNEIIGFNVASLAPAANYARKGRAMTFTGPGIACDWLDIEGPLHGTWPPVSHKTLFGELPLTEFVGKEHPETRPPVRKTVRQIGAGMNRPDVVPGLWTIQSENPVSDADKLLATFLPKAFRRPVTAEIRAAYVDKVEARLAAGDCFETAMRWAYRAALCSPDFLYHVEPEEKLSTHALACRLSYMLWNSLPDTQLRQLADSGELTKPNILKAEVERLLKDAKSQRFIDDFLGQWLKLRQIAANDPDRKLYPEFSPYLQDSMVAETRGYFRELLEQNLSASYLVQSNFAMLNEKLAKHYGIEGVSGAEIRKVALPEKHYRGPFLTQAAILKITANGTTTSPVPRGAFVMARLLGKEPEPPPANVAAIEPDVRGASTIREQLEKHRTQVVCASCHANIDPPGFALEAFDVLGSYRERYRSIGEGDAAPRGNIDPFIGISFKLGPKVDASSVLPTGEKFQDICEFQTLLAARPRVLLNNLAQQLLIYGTGRPLAFRDRAMVEKIVSATEKQGGGLRTLLHEILSSSLFQTK
jgi:Protein of unknown function (DUF1592)/Protein of unknown function (DUF1588)/Protein of unknown function (DUF1587)/Protein of unknown function (DUF1585)/Protein of unknown function (DUF1595)/Planctomycete cytochrome C